jgi:hypothetical protein
LEAGSPAKKGRTDDDGTDTICQESQQRQHRIGRSRTGQPTRKQRRREEQDQFKIIMDVSLRNDRATEQLEQMGCGVETCQV